MHMNRSDRLIVMGDFGMQAIIRPHLDNGSKCTLEAAAYLEDILQACWRFAQRVHDLLHRDLTLGQALHGLRVVLLAPVNLCSSRERRLNGQEAAWHRLRHQSQPDAARRLG